MENDIKESIDTTKAHAKAVGRLKEKIQKAINIGEAKTDTLSQKSTVDGLMGNLMKKMFGNNNVRVKKNSFLSTDGQESVMTFFQQLRKEHINREIKSRLFKDIISKEKTAKLLRQRSYISPDVSHNKLIQHGHGAHGRRLTQ